MNERAQFARDAVHEFFSWWVDELRNLLPGNMRSDPTVRDRFDIFLSEHATAIEFVEGGSGRKMLESCSIERLPEESWDQIAEFSGKKSARLYLEEEDFLAIPVSLPKASQAQLLSAIQLQLANLVPLEASLIDWDFVVPDRNDRSVSISLIVAKSERLDDIESRFAERGLMPPCFCADHKGQTVILRKPLELAQPPMEERKAIFALAVVAMLAATPLIALAGAKALNSMEEERIARLEQILDPRLAEEKQIVAEEMVRRAAAPLLIMPSASNRLELLAQTLPDTDWTVSVTQSADGRFLFVADIENLELTEKALASSKFPAGIEPVEELEGSSERSRLRYEVGR